MVDQVRITVAHSKDRSAGAQMLGFSTIVAFVASAAALLYVKDLRLPYPCFQVVQTVPIEQRAAPSDLQGPYAINLHLQKAKKLFENEVSGVGTWHSLPDSTHVPRHVCTTAGASIVLLWNLSLTTP
jgi:hypothetical protein